MNTHRVLRICLFGKPALYVDGRLQSFGGPRKAIALLGYVLLHGERPLSRAAVAAQFWPDESDEEARASLRRHLHRALAALPEPETACPWIIADKVTIRWNPDAPLELDTRTYERLTAEGQREAAVALYRGDYLEDFYDEWVLPERERLRELQAANLAQLIADRRRALDYPAAIGFAQALQRFDPLHEDAIRRLMALRFAAGDRSGALADFETFSRRLRDELTADPMPETIALREAIRNNDLTTLENGHAAAESLPRPAFPFAGRNAALGALQAAWEAAARGTTSTAIVSGQAGIGKSRLIAELMALAEAQGGRVTFGTTATTETEPYQPIAEALRGALPLLRFDRLEPVTVAALAALIPDIRDTAPNVIPLVRLEPERERQRLFDAVASAFGQLAEKRPLLVVFEDVHWASAPTIELLDVIVRRVQGKSVLVVVSFRDEDVGESHALRAFLRSADDRRSNHVALGPLAVDDVRDLIAGIAGDAPDALAEEIFAASEGNALFVTELLRERLRGAKITGVPSGIAEMVVTRVNGLSEPARSLVEAAAVAGVGFDAEVLREACGWSFAEVFDALDELLDRALVRVSPRRRSGFAFSHQLVHAAVYGTVDESARRGLHRRMARTLERLFPERTSMIGAVARHLDAAGLPAEAVVRYLAAVRHALDVFAQSDAAALATRALDLTSDPRDRYELHRLREEAVARADHGATRQLDCDSMIELANELRDDDLLGNALRTSIALCRHRSATTDAAVAIDALRALGERTGSARWSFQATLAQAGHEISRSNFHAADAILHDAEPLVTGEMDDAAAFEYWYVRAFVAAWGVAGDARTFLALAQARLGGNPLRALRALRVEALIAEVEGDALTLRRVANALLELALQTGDVESQAMAHRNLANAAYTLFEVTADRAHTQYALALFERVQKPQAIAAVLNHRAVCAHQFGDFAAAERDFRAALSMWHEQGQRVNACSAMINLALLEVFRDDHARARELALEALEFARSHQLEWAESNALDALGIAESNAGTIAEARRHLETALRRHRQRDPRGGLETLIELIPIYLAKGEAAKAVAAANQLVGVLSSDRTAVPFPAYALNTAAAAYDAAGIPKRANALRSDARVLLAELAARIDDEKSRRGYLSLYLHRSILGADAAAAESEAQPSP